MKNHPRRNMNQRGVVSILVTMIMMLVISLIVIGFSQIARRNQRESLDRQLSTQAYYAAESGVNVAASYIAQNSNSVSDTLSGGNCKQPIGTAGSAPRAPLILGQGVTTSCLMTNPTPPSLIANPVTQDSNVVWHVLDNSGLSFRDLTFTWASNSSYGGINNCSSPMGSLPSYNSWNCAFGILRVDLVNTASLSQSNLENSANNWTLYLVPRGLVPGATPVANVNLSTRSTIVDTSCSTSQKKCSVKISNLSSSDYYARLTMIYQDSDSVLLTGSDPAGGAKFKDGQAVIDATGVSQDESRRVQVRVPLHRVESVLPLFGLQSTNTICKQLNVSPDGYEDSCP